jgi:glycosyltransferase involved in cell wall biosynthesis
MNGTKPVPSAAARPRIAFLLDHPTQFDSPLFRHGARQGDADFSVIYRSVGAASSVFDSELGRVVDWGEDLLAGYDSRQLPATGCGRWLWQLLREGRYDWLIINGYDCGDYRLALLLARLLGIRVGLRIDAVLFNRGGWPKRLARRLVNPLLLRLYDRIFAAGSLTGEYLRHYGVAAIRIARFPYVVDCGRFAAAAEALRGRRAAIRAGFGLPENAKVILAVAKMSPRESPRDLLRALADAPRGDWWTLIVGDGAERPALEAFVHDRQLANVRFTGYLPYADLVSAYVAADLFVHAASNEPWGVSVHEAIACGLPVIASDRVGAARDLIRPGGNGYVYASGDARELAARLAQLLDRPDPAALLAANRDVLAEWNHEQSWSGIVEACRDRGARP